MPRYDYLCPDCGDTTEVRATLAEKDAGLSPACQTCGSADVRRRFSPIAVSGGDGAAVPVAGGGGGGCCGGACGCG